MIPGSNIFKLASRVIATALIDHYPTRGRELNELGQFISSYPVASTIKGSIQAVPRTLYEKLGLDMQQNYVYIYCSANIADIAVGTGGDQFAFGGKRWQALSKTDWFGYDGWVSVLCVEVPKP